MSEVGDDLLEDIGKGKVAPVYLLAGDEFLVRKGADELVKALVPDAAMGLNYVVLDGGSPREVANELATLPLFPGRKVVLIRDPEFLAPKKGRGDALGKAREAWRAGRRKEGARRVLALAARAGWGAAQLDPSNSGAPSAEQWREELGVELADADIAFLKDVAAFCRDEGVTAPESDVSALLDLLEKGLPKGHALVVAATDLDAKNPVVKWAKDNGELIERKVASKLKDLDLSDLSAEVLRPLKKRLSKEAEKALKDRCGGNMRLVQSELEKLALYVEGTVIEVEDVELLVSRAREEEFMELSDALQKRDLESALRYAHEAMGQGNHPLQLLGTTAAIVRTLLENHERMRKIAGGNPPRSFDDFKHRVFPKIEQEAKEAKLRVPHPYAAFMSMQAAGRFKRTELLASLAACADADLGIKSSASGQLVIERLFWTICGRAPAPEPRRVKARR